MDNVTTGVDRTADRSGIPSLRSPPLLVGRSREQDVLRVELAAARAGNGRLVLLGGEAGIGKTSLARSLSHEAAALGCRILAGSCYDLSNTPPYGPWLDLFEQCWRDPGLPSPPAAFVRSKLERVTDQAALFGEVRQFLAELTANDPAFILLEDLHWADQASIDLLRHVGPHLRHWPIMLLATYRVDELSRGQPLSRQLPALVREADGHRLDLRRLDLNALRALVTGRYRLSRPNENHLVTYLERHAEGNPFFATELLRTLEEGALLHRDQDGWSLDELDRVFVPSLLRQVIDGRAARLSETTRKALALAAVIGQEIPLALWADVAALDEEGLLEVVEQAVEAHLLEAERDGTRVRFVHALTREALYEGILPPRRRTWHRHVAEALLASADPDPDAVAYHLQQSGDPRAWEWLVQAADRAMRTYAWLTAADRLRAAAVLLESVDGEVGTRARLLFRLGNFQRMSDPGDAIAPLTEVELLAAQAGEALLAAEARFGRGLFLCYSDRSKDGLAAMAEGLEALEAMSLDAAEILADMRALFVATIAGTVSPPTPGDELAAARLRAAGLHWLRCELVWFLALAGQPRDAVASGERFLAVLADLFGVTEGIRWTAAFADHGLGIAYAALGRPDDAREVWARSRTIFRDLGHHVLVAFTLCHELWDRVYPFSPTDPGIRRRYVSEAEAALARAAGALAPGVSPRIAWLSCFVLDGRWQEALAILEDLPMPGNACLRREVSGPHATIARHRGDAETAWRQIRPLFPAGPATAPGDLIHQEGLLLQRLAADLCLDTGDLPGARAWLEAHNRWLAWSESVLGRADGRLAWARYHWAAGDAALARSAAAEALALAEAPRQPLVCLAAHRLLGEIETRAEQYAAAESHLSIALDLANACEAPFERALTLLALAELRLAMGKAGETAILLDDVRATCAPLGAAPTLARADALARRLQTTSNVAGLTQRELEVLRLIVAGRSNQAIADELFISRDTARTHVANIFRKLDVRTRAETVDHAHRHGLLSSLPPAST